MRCFKSVHLFMTYLKSFCNFAVADRLADHASRVRFHTEPKPGLGLSGAGCI